MKAFVTGAAGFLGRHIVDELLARGYEIVTVVRPTSDTKYLEERKVRLIEGDLRDPSCIEQAAKGADVIVHSAAALKGKWEDFYDINFVATKQVLEQAVKQKVKRFVFISSIIVYDHSSASSGTTFDETMPYEEAEQTYYCKTKIEAEQFVSSFQEKHGLKTVILRPGALYGLGGPLFLSRLGFALGGNRYLVVGNGSLPLPLSHVEGVAQAVTLAVEKKAAIGKTYNVVEDEAITQNNYFAEVKRLVKPNFKTLKLPYKFVKFLSQSADKVLGLVNMTSPLNLSYMRLCVTPFMYSNEKIKSELGWEPQDDFKGSIRDMMAWHRAKVQPQRTPNENRAQVRLASQEKMRVGIIGCGVIAGPHLDALRKLENTEVVAVCDPLESVRNDLAKKYQVASTYADYKEMLSNERLNAVHVCSPAQSHAAASIAALNEGCHVFVEKPMALTAAEAKKMVAAAKKNKVKLCVDHNHLYDRVMIKARSLVASGALGRVSYVECWYGTSYSSDAGSRYLTWQARDNWAYDMPGRLYQNFISHPISLLLDVMGDAEVQGVHAKYHRIVPHMKTDELRVTLENESMLGMFSLSMAVSPRYLFLNVYGTEGTLKVDLLNQYVFVDSPMAKLPRVVGRSVMAMSQAKTLLGSGVRNAFMGVLGKYNLYQGNETLIRLFYKHILEDAPAPISAEEGLRSMELMDEIWKKLPGQNGASKGKTVSKNVVSARRRVRRKKSGEAVAG